MISATFGLEAGHKYTADRVKPKKNDRLLRFGPNVLTITWAENKRINWHDVPLEMKNDRHRPSQCTRTLKNMPEMKSALNGKITVG